MPEIPPQKGELHAMTEEEYEYVRRAYRIISRAFNTVSHQDIQTEHLLIATYMLIGAFEREYAKATQCPENIDALKRIGYDYSKRIELASMFVDNDVNEKLK